MDRLTGTATLTEFLRFGTISVAAEDDSPDGVTPRERRATGSLACFQPGGNRWKDDLLRSWQDRRMCVLQRVTAGVHATDEALGLERDRLCAEDGMDEMSPVRLGLRTGGNGDGPTARENEEPKDLFAWRGWGGDRGRLGLATDAGRLRPMR